MSLEKNISFVLLEPGKAGNTGASARAIYNMGFKNLVIVNSKVYLEEEALNFAMNGTNVLKNAKTYENFDDAVSGSSLVAGLTRRKGKKRGQFFSFDEGIKTIIERGRTNKVSLVFGRESSGLSNEETEKCTFLITIPTGRISSSLNLAQAVLIAAYEISQYKTKSPSSQTIKSIPIKKLDFLFAEINDTLSYLGYERRGNKDMKHSIMRTMKKLFARTGLTNVVLNMFLGLCREIRKNGR